MGERKVLNKYIPPDFDPSILPKFKRERNKLMEIRMMLPFSLRCSTCGEFMYKGKKFNSKKEDVVGEDYMGIRKIRFYIKCVVCSSEIAFRTDPKNSDYECEWGASRNFEVWRENVEAMEELSKEREEEEKQDAMKSLENRTLDSKIEMDVLDALDEIKAINQRHERVDTDALLQNITHSNKTSTNKSIQQQDEDLIKSINFKSKSISQESQSINTITSTSTTSTQKDLFQKIQNEMLLSDKSNQNINASKSTITVKKKRKIASSSNEKKIDSSKVIKISEKDPKSLLSPAGTALSLSHTEKEGSSKNSFDDKNTVANEDINTIAKTTITTTVTNNNSSSISSLFGGYGNSSSDEN